MLQLMDAINDGFGSFVSLVIFVELIRRLDANRRRFLFALCLVGIVVSEVAQAGLRYRMAELTGEMIVTMEDKPPMVMRPMDRLRPERRERYTSFVARSVFQDSGKLMSVMDAAGNSRLFAPSQRELRLREDYLVAVGDLNGRATVCGACCCAMPGCCSERWCVRRCWLPKPGANESKRSDRDEGCCRGLNC